MDTYMPVTGTYLMRTCVHDDLHASTWRTSMTFNCETASKLKKFCAPEA